MTWGIKLAGKLGVAAAITMAWTIAASPPAQADLFGSSLDDAAEATEATETTSSILPEQPDGQSGSGFTAESLAAALPRDWHGTFAWEDGDAYFVEVHIVTVTVRDTGELGFTAETRWLPDELRARMTGRISPDGLKVRIWEVADDASADSFDSDGLYDGRFSDDLWDLRARWTTTTTGETGTLTLVAESQPALAE